MRIRLTWSRGAVEIALASGPTARAVAAALPAEALAHRWGDEVYFRLSVAARLDDDASDVVPAGAVCYWVEGESVAIPFGPTPASRADECRLVTRVNRIGAVEGDPGCLGSVEEGDRVVVAVVDG